MSVDHVDSSAARLLPPSTLSRDSWRMEIGDREKYLLFIKIQSRRRKTAKRVQKRGNSRGEILWNHKWMIYVAVRRRM